MSFFSVLALLIVYDLIRNVLIPRIIFAWRYRREIADMRSAAQNNQP